MLGLPPRHPRRRIAQGSSARLSRLHLSGSQLGLNALGCDASDGVICGRAGFQRRLTGLGRKLSLPVLSRMEEAASDIGGGLAGLVIGSPGQAETESAGSGTLCFRSTPPAGAGAAYSSEPVSRRSPAPADCALTAWSACDTDWQEWGAGGAAVPPAAQFATVPAQGGAGVPWDGDGGAAAPAPNPSIGTGAAPGCKNKVFAGNIPYTASRAQLRELFEHFGTVASVHLVRNPTNGRHRGFGFVTFKDATSADNCLAADLTPYLYMDRRQIRVSRAQQRKPGYNRSRKRPPVPFQPSAPSHIDRLPNELLHHIFSYLTVSQQLDLQSVSRRWQQVVRSLLSRRHRLDLDECIKLTSDRRLTDYMLKRLLKLMPSLRHLRTGGHVRSCTWKALEIVASCCANLVEIDLDGFCINEVSLKNLCVACPELETVLLPHHYHFSESSVWVIVRYLQKLRVLDLNHSGRVTGECFALLPASLERLVLAECLGLQSSALRYLSRCPHLTELDISAVTSIKNEDLAVALAACPKLQRLTVRRLQIAPEKCIPETGMPQLRHLDAAFSYGVTDSTLRQLPHLVPDLHTLSVQGCGGLTEEGLMHLHRLKQLRSLDLGYMKVVNDAVLAHLCNQHLSQLHLPEGYSGPADFTADGVKRTVLDYRALTLLDLSGVQLVTEELVEELMQQLTPERDVTLYAGGTDAQDLCNPDNGVWGDKPLRVQDTNTVPLHMRGYPDDDYPSGSDYEYDSDLDDLDLMDDMGGVYVDEYGLGYDSDGMFDPGYEFMEHLDGADW